MPPLPPALRRAAARARRRDFGIVPSLDSGVPLGVFLKAPQDPVHWSHSHRFVAALEPGDRRRLGLALLSDPHGTKDICLEAALTQHTCGWSPEETEGLLELSLLDSDHSHRRVCRALGLPLAAVREQEPSERARYQPQIRRIMLGALVHHAFSRHCEWHLTDCTAAELLGLPQDRQALDRLRQIVRKWYARSNRILVALGPRVFEPGVTHLLATLASIDNFHPAPSWLSRVRKRLETLPAAPDVLRTLLSFDDGGSGYDAMLPECGPAYAVLEDTLAAGAAWAACLTGDPALISLVGERVLRRARARTRPGLSAGDTLSVRAAVTALNAAAGLPALGRPRAALTGLPTGVADAARAALDTIADAYLPEPEGSDEVARVVSFEDYTASLTVRPHGSVVVDVRDSAGRPVTPYTMRRLNWLFVPELTALRHRLPRLVARADHERGVLEELLVDSTGLAGARFRSRWLEHAVAGPLVRALIWEADTTDGTRTGLPVGGPDGRVLLRDTHRETHEIADTDTLRLWNPARADQAQISAWRTVLEREGVRQPVRQLPVAAVRVGEGSAKARDAAGTEDAGPR
ncbi:DUF4132 domain-containing protein [Streptomyces griseoruber]|uniref:DUF4132 domain-containing protein n=2 Tax=Streptomyces griseoruber TaxID=1943 RepID=UPI00131E264A|nr:DUF4132 domain-containing protein [Streptomyces griseoruber]